MKLLGKTVKLRDIYSKSIIFKSNRYLIFLVVIAHATVNRVEHSLASRAIKQRL